MQYYMLRVQNAGPENVWPEKNDWFIIRAEDVGQRRRYCDHFITLCACGYVCGWLSVKQNPWS